jgi:hypothetical protein
MLIGRPKFEVFLHLNQRFLDFALNDKRTVKYFLQIARFPLYSPLTASGAWESLLRDLGGFFVAPSPTLLAAFCF